MRERDLVPLYTFSAFYLVQKFVKSSCFLCDPLEFLSSYCKSKSLAFIRLSHSSVIATLGGRGGGGDLLRKVYELLRKVYLTVVCIYLNRCCNASFVTLHYVKQIKERKARLCSINC